MSQLFNGGNFAYRSVDVFWTFSHLFASFSQFPKLLQSINYTGDLLGYVLDRLFDNLTDKSYSNVDDRNNVDMLRIITRKSKSKFQLTIGLFSIAFVMSVIEKFAEFLNTLTIKYKLRNNAG